MAERRMFAKTIIDSDEFLDMPSTCQLLYFHLGMRADDDGVINNPKSVMRLCGAKNDDINVLIMKKFIININDKVLVIKHWRINNYLRNDRYKHSKYSDLLSILELDENGSYRLPKVEEQKLGIPTGYQRDTQYRIGKDSIEKENNNINIISKEKSSNFKKPTIEEIENYCKERNNNVNSQVFYDFYESKGWLVGKAKMKDWKAAIRLWERNNKDKSTTTNVKNKTDYSGCTFEDI